ncbi:MAG: hypothetical protein F2934_01950 [Actinobacteria bacterium]|uniref:Unannotated protein n=1 Tax=freshwater metagenome TaxID=449393 RepID=A0A6J7TMA8_9ZZZZ|nr:hypothetical protein [Actinomycetota bacterium]MSZ03649.1 hypothetical protein [Actinomycetota bacterium]MTB05875.1 hypothetical protein [Actinomycetota bacterium]
MTKGTSSPAEAAAAGGSQFANLTADERTAAHALIDAAIAERVADLRFGTTTLSSGQITVSVDGSGHLVEIAPDGTSRRL